MQHGRPAGDTYVYVRRVGDGHRKARLVFFARAMGASGDCNLIDFHLDTGLVYKGPLSRVEDQLGLAIGYAHVGSAARGLDAVLARFTGQLYPIRSGKTVLELTYRLQLTGWWQLQPDFQYVLNPAGGIANPKAPTRPIGEAAVLGLRTVISF